VAVTATVVSRSRGLPTVLGEKLVIVDGQLRDAGFGWPQLHARVMADAPSVVADGRSQSRTYTFAADGDDPAAAKAGQVAVYFDLTVPRPTLVVVGAGHVAMPIAQVGRLLDFEVIVVDDRPSFANAERFPDADRIIVDDFSTALDDIDITPSTYLVLVTRAHTHDVHALRKIVRQPAGYIGMIGSRRRVYAVFKLLRDEGVPVEELLRVHAPIGLDIKTETPGEIAISVGAELLKARRGGGAASMSDILRPQYRFSLSKGDNDI
jgi:xanthine dehydrogenase accessory factor